MNWFITSAKNILINLFDQWQDIEKTDRRHFDILKKEPTQNSTQS